MNQKPAAQKKSKAATVAVLANPTTVSDLNLTDVERALAEYLDVDLTVSAAIQIARAKESSRVLLREEIRLGLRLMALKEQLEHGEFIPALTEIGIGERAAQRAMQTARAFAAEGDARRREQLLALGKTKGVALLAANPEVRDAILSDPDMAREAEEASKIELQQLLKDKEAQIERKDAAYHDLEEKLEDREQRLQKLSRVDPVSLLTRSIRAEAMADAEALSGLCDNLSLLWDRVITESIAAEQRDLRARAVAIAVGSAMSALQALYTTVKDDLGDTLQLPPGPLDDLSPEEQHLATECLARVRGQFDSRRTQRKEDAYAEHVADGGPKRRGRPPKKAGV